MSIEGRVLIDVTRGLRPAVRVSYAQPGDATRVLEGRTVAEALAIIPALYALCGKAQTQAACLALDAAEGRARAPSELAAMQCLTEMESLRENALRVLLDWARALGEAPDTAAPRALMQLVQGLDEALSAARNAEPAHGSSRLTTAAVDAVIARAEALLAAHVFGEPLSHFHARRSGDEIRAWAAAHRTAAARLLQQVHARGLAAAGAIDVRMAAPLTPEAVRGWLTGGDDAAPAMPARHAGGTPETTALSRHVSDVRLGGPDAATDGSHGLASRLTARLIELSELPGRMRDLVEGRLQAATGRSLGAGSGVSEVTAARGTLVHAVSVDAGRITRYRVLAPTRLHFDTHGAAARALGRIATEHAHEVVMLSELMVEAIDPCVAYEVRVH